MLLGHGTLCVRFRYFSVFSNVQKITSAENLRSRASDDELNTNSNRKNCGSYFLNITKRATNWIDKHGVITLQEYATLNNLSRPSASGELKKLSEGNEVPSESKGKGSHKVWVKAGWLGKREINVDAKIDAGRLLDKGEASVICLTLAFL